MPPTSAAASTLAERAEVPARDGIAGTPGSVTTSCRRTSGSRWSPGPTTVGASSAPVLDLVERSALRHLQHDPGRRRGDRIVRAPKLRVGPTDSHTCFMDAGLQT